MVLFFQPLFQENHHKHGGHHKADACGIKFQKRANKSADGRPGKPVKMVQQGHKEKEPSLVHAVRDLCRIVDGKGLITHSENQISLFPPHAFILVQHGYAVKQVACLYQQCHDKHLYRGKRTEQHLHSNKFQ